MNLRRAGHIPDASVGEWLRDNQEALPKQALAVVSMMDSDDDVLEMPWARNMVAAPGGAELMPVVQLFSLLDDHNLFNGFDEVWLCDVAPEEAMPDLAHIVAPVNLATDDPGVAFEWGEKNGVVLGLGDGEGLNFIAMDPEIAALFT